MRVRTKPVEVEVVQWKGNNVREIHEWIDKRIGDTFATPDTIAYFVPRRSKDMTETLWRNIAEESWGKDITAAIYDYLHETYVGMKTGHWIICGLKGEFYPCDPETLWAKYEEISRVPLDDEQFDSIQSTRPQDGSWW